MWKIITLIALSCTMELAQGQVSVSTLIRSDITGSDVDCGQGGARCRICGDINSVTSSCSSNPSCVAFTFDGSCGFLKSAAGPTSYREGYTTFVLNNKGAAPAAAAAAASPPAAAAATTPAATPPVQVAAAPAPAPAATPPPPPPAATPSPSPSPPPAPAPAPAPAPTPAASQPIQVSAPSSSDKVPVQQGSSGGRYVGEGFPIGFGSGFGGGGFGFPGRKLLLAQQQA